MQQLKRFIIEIIEGNGMGKVGVSCSLVFKYHVYSQNYYYYYYIRIFTAVGSIPAGNLDSFM